MTVWVSAHKLLWWAMAALFGAAMAALLRTEVVPPLFVFGQHLVGIPAPVLLTAAVATCVIGGLLSSTPQSERAGMRSLWLLEAAWCTSAWAAATGVYFATLAFVPGADGGLEFVRNVGGLLAAGLLARRWFGTVLGSLVPIAWVMCILAFGTPDGDAGLSWPTSPIGSRGTITAVVVLTAGLVLGLGRRSRN